MLEVLCERCAGTLKIIVAQAHAGFGIGQSVTITLCERCGTAHVVGVKPGKSTNRDYRDSPLAPKRRR